MKRFFAGMVFLALTAMTMNAQEITWNVAGANPAQYKSISADELRYMFKNNQLAGNQKYKTVIDGQEDYLTALSLRELTVLSKAGAGAELSSRYFYFKNLPVAGAAGRKIEIYFSQGITLENLADYVKWNSILNNGVKIPVIPVDGYRVL
jgi:hypothetical protein